MSAPLCHCLTKNITKMKTKNFLLVVLFSIGFLMTSYSQDYGSQSAAFDRSSLDQEHQAVVKKNKPQHIDIMIDPIQNFPNPFSGTTTIEYRLWRSDKVSLMITNEKNERVDYLAPGYLREGVYNYQFDARDLPSGVYTATLRVGNSVVHQRMIKQDDPDHAPLAGVR